MKRKLKWTAAVLAVLLLGFGTAIFLWPRDRITVETYKKLRIGITEGEVEGLLGGPGISEDVFMAQLNVLEKQVGKFPYVEDGTHFAEPECFDCPPDTSMKVWIGRTHGLVWIQFNREGRVRSKIFRAVRSAEPTFFERLRDWLGW